MIHAYPVISIFDRTNNYILEPLFGFSLYLSGAISSTEKNILTLL